MRWLSLIMSILLLPPAIAEIIDRIAVTVENQVITESEIMHEIRLTAFLNGEKLDFSPDAKRKAAGRLVEQKLIRREIDLGRYVQPDPAEVEPVLKQVLAQRFQTPQQYQDALKEYGITEEDLKAHLLWQTTLVRFIDVRFRPGVQVSDEEVRQYVAKEFPALQKQAGAGDYTDLDGVRQKIEQAIVAQKIDQQMDQWLEETKKRTRIEYRPEVFQ